MHARLVSRRRSSPICDGLVWSELAAALPGTGGTYFYLREIFRKTSLGGILPFLFIWQFIFSGPLEIASGYIGFSQYVGYFWRGMTPAGGRAVAIAVGVLVIALLYRRITAIGKMTVVLWIGMLITVLWIIASGFANFHSNVVFDFPPNAFRFSTGFAAGLGSAMLIAMYDFMGYYDICYVGGEVRDPARTIPRSILISVIVVAAIYAAMNLSIIAVVPWREAMQSKFIASQFIERLYGTRAASTVTVLVLWTAFASVFALLFGYSRIPYAAAVNGHFFRFFAQLHPEGRFPHVSLLVVGGLSIVASLFDLDAVISALLTSRILVQFLTQIAALHYMRKHRPDIERPFRMWLYPVPERDRLHRMGVHLRDLRMALHRVRIADARRRRPSLTGCGLESRSSARRRRFRRAARVPAAAREFERAFRVLAILAAILAVLARHAVACRMSALLLIGHVRLHPKSRVSGVFAVCAAAPSLRSKGRFRPKPAIVAIRDPQPLALRPGAELQRVVGVGVHRKPVLAVHRLANRGEARETGSPISWCGSAARPALPSARCCNPSCPPRSCRRKIAARIGSAAAAPAAPSSPHRPSSPRRGTWSRSSTAGPR